MSPRRSSSNGDGQGEKGVSPQVLKRTVVDIPPEPAEGAPPPSTGLLFFVGQAADEFRRWGEMPKLRDRQLREFVPKETMYSSALGIVCARNAGFSWALEGPPRTVSTVQEKLEASNFGRGWHDLILETSFDLYNQDAGTFIEVARDGDSPEAPFIALNHLDAARCHPTGSPESPVIYEDEKGMFHRLKWWNVLHLREMPVPGSKGLQVCALSRLLLAAQIVRNIALYQREKVGGRNTKAIHLVQGVAASEVQDAIDIAKAHADAAGLLRYMSPVIVGSKDPAASVDVKTLELAALPESFSEETMFKWYIAQIAMAFETDYQEFAPLPGGNLGTSAQSEILHLKSRGKGPGLFMKLISHALNFLVLPKNVTFLYDEQDLEAELALANVQKIRAETRKLQVESGELTEEGARQRALDDGDMSQELFDALGGSDLTPNVTLSDEDKPPAGGEERRVEEGEKGARAYRPFGQTATDEKAAGPARAGPFEDDRLAAEARFADVIEKALVKIFARVKKRLREEAGRKALSFVIATDAKELKPGMFDDAAFWGLAKEELVGASMAEAQGLLLEGAQQASRLGLAVDFELVNENVLKFSRQYSDDWWRQLSKTNRRVLRSAIGANIEAGAPLSSLVKSLEPTFGRARAELIASTEVTRLYSEGNRMAYATAGVDQVEWRTVRDSRVDPICDALHGERWAVGKEKQVPPAHPGCRCWLAPVVDNSLLSRAARKEDSGVAV